METRQASDLLAINSLMPGSKVCAITPGDASFCFFFPLVKMEFGCVVQAGLVFEAPLLPQLPKCRNNRCGPLCPTVDSHMCTHTHKTPQPQQCTEDHHL